MGSNNLTNRYIYDMRTAISLGLTAIADSIRKDWLVNADHDVVMFASTVLVFMILMDIAEFIKKMHSKS